MLLQFSRRFADPKCVCSQAALGLFRNLPDASSGTASLTSAIDKKNE
jgi:hypothetical protein